MKTFAIDIRLIGKKRTGDETVFFHLVKELLMNDKNNRYLLLTDNRDPQDLAVIRGRLDCVGQKNVEIKSLYGKNRFIWNLFTLPWFLFRHSIDVYHTQYILPFIIPEHTKVVAHIHDVSFRVYPELIALTDRFFLGLLIPLSLRRAALIAVPSKFTKNEVVKYYGTDPSKIVVIPNALGDDFLACKSDIDKKAFVRKKYHLPEHYIVYVGTLQPRKNIPFLIEAVARLKEQLQKSSQSQFVMKLVLVGNRKGHNVDGRLSETLERVNMTTEVVFPGFVDQSDLPYVIQAADIFVLPSLYEGFGIPLLEAMSQAVPVACSNILSLMEVGAHAVLYFDPTSLASCVEKMYTLATAQGKKMELIALGNARIGDFSWKKSALILHDVYEKLSLEKQG